MHDVFFRATDFQPHIYTDDEILRYFHAVDTYTSERSRMDAVQFPVLFRLLYCCGTRINETLGIKKKDVDLENGIIRLMETKNDCERYIVLDPEIKSLFEQFSDKCFYLFSDDDYIFPSAASIQSATIFTGMSAALFVMLSTLGPQTLTANLPAASLNLFSGDGEFIFSMAGPIVLASAVNQIAFQSVASAKSVNAARGGYLLAGLLLIPIAMIPPLLGMFGRVLFPDLPAEEVFTALLLTRLPTVVAAVILAAVVCAVVASCNSAYIAVATNAVHDIYQGMLNPQADSRTCKRLMVLVDVAVCAVGILLALRMNDIIKVLSMGYSLISAGCLVPFLGGVLWKGGTSRGALTGAFVGMGACLADALGLFPLPYAGLSCILLSAAAYVVGSVLWKNPS